MQHDKEGCLQSLQGLLSDEDITNILGFGNDRPDTLRHRFELGRCDARFFLDQVLTHCKKGTTEQQFIDAWNTIHAGIPDSASLRPQVKDLIEEPTSRGFRVKLIL